MQLQVMSRCVRSFWLRAVLGELLLERLGWGAERGTEIAQGAARGELGPALILSHRQSSKHLPVTLIT